MSELTKKQVIHDLAVACAAKIEFEEGGEATGSDLGDVLDDYLYHVAYFNKHWNTE